MQGRARRRHSRAGKECRGLNDPPRPSRHIPELEALRNGKVVCCTEHLIGSSRLQKTAGNHEGGNQQHRCTAQDQGKPTLLQAIEDKCNNADNNGDQIEKRIIGKFTVKLGYSMLSFETVVA
ncbi:hypothetical protein [Arthrobacter sp. NPDC093139]|uniref:hypothetical protein n=1 Tax=Arthrobacter sp. NPDC093139 TaxID=3363945 RepID=UPI00382FE7C8